MDPVIDATLRAGLSLLFVVAAGHKLRDLARFRATLADYRLLPDAIVPPGAAAVAGGELAVALALAIPRLRAAGLLAAAAVLLVYGAAIAVNLVRGRRHIDCGCAGPAVRRPISGWLVARNALLAAVALAGLAPVRARALVWPDALSILGATAVLAALYAAVDRMLAAAPALASLRGDA
jgi:Methylamine utilisation protein MauE